VKLYEITGYLHLGLALAFEKEWKLKHFLLRINFLLNLRENKSPAKPDREL
jgi:hypothetical protein